MQLDAGGLTARAGEWVWSLEALDAIIDRLVGGSELGAAADFHRGMMGIGQPFARWAPTSRDGLRALILERCAERGIMLPAALGAELVGGAVAMQTTAVPARPRPPRVRVHISREDRYSQWEIRCTVDGAGQGIPVVPQVRPLLQPEHRRLLPAIRVTSRYRSERAYQHALDAGLPVQALADAMKAYFIAQLAQPTEAQAEGDVLEDTALMRMQPATLVVGGAAYRLVPTGGVDLRNPLRNMRRRAREVAQAEARELNAAATRDAQLIVRNAEAAAATIRQDIERERQQAARIVPPWLLAANRPFWPDSDSRDRWKILISSATQLREIQMAVPAWNSTLYWDALPVTEAYVGPDRLQLTLSIGADGSYSFAGGSIRCYGCYTAPHIDSGRVCMEVQGQPARITSAADLGRLEEVLSRGMEVVNMNSLLTHNSHYWHPRIQLQLPEAIKRMTGVGEPIQQMRRLTTPRAAYAGPILWDREVSMDAEAAELFTVDAAGRLRP